MFTEGLSAAGTIVAPTPNVITKTDLQRAVRTYELEYRVRGTVTLAGGPATAILNGGSILAAFLRLGTDENGTRWIDVDPLLAYIYHQMMTQQDTAKNRVRLTNPANGAYDLEESVFLPFAGVGTAVPSETLYLERDARKNFSAFVTQGPVSVAGTLVQTPGTAVLSNVSVSVTQRYDTDRSDGTILLPSMRQEEKQITGVSTEFPFKLESEKYLQGLIVQQWTTGAGEVADIINSLALRADGWDGIGPSLVGYEELQARAQLEFSGSVVERGNLPIWFRKGGRLSNVLNPNALANLRLLLNCQPSATVGAGTSIVRVCYLELERVPGLTAATVPYQI